MKKLKMPDADTDTYVRGFKCPSCGSSAVALANGNYLTCMSLDCPNPDVAEVLQNTPPNPLQPAGGRRPKNFGTIPVKNGLSEMDTVTRLFWDIDIDLAERFHQKMIDSGKEEHWRYLYDTKTIPLILLFMMEEIATSNQAAVKEELERIDSANKDNGINFYFPDMPDNNNNHWYTMRQYVAKRLAHLQTPPDRINHLKSEGEK